MFDYEELQLIIEMIEMNLAIKADICPDMKTGDHTYLQSQKNLLNKCYRIRNQQDDYEITYFDAMDEDNE